VYRRLMTIALLAGAAVALAACSSPTTGSPSPATTASSSAKPASDPLASIDPCTLIPPNKVTANGLIQNPPGIEDGARACSWTQRPGNGTANLGFGLGIRLYEHAGLTEARAQAGAGNTVTDLQVGQHKGIEIKVNVGLGTGSCAVFLGVSATTSVFVNAVDGGGNQANSCADATAAATAVEPRVPAETG
jgi:hypothetical protein